MTPERLRQLEVFHRMPDRMLEDWWLHSRLTSVPAGARLYSEKDAPEHVYVLFTGVARGFCHGPGAAELMTRLLPAPSLFGEVEVLMGGLRMESIEMLKPSQVLVTPRQVMQKTLQDCPEFARALLQLGTQRLRQSLESKKEMAFDTVERRLGANLLQYARVFGVDVGSQACIARKIGVGELAADLAVSRKSIQRALDALVRRKLIVREKKLFYLPSVSVLREFVGDAAQQHRASV